MHNLSIKQHEENMRNLIHYAIDVGTGPYASSIYNSNDELVAIAMGNHDSPINHAEINAINQCAKQNLDINWSELILYTTCEPNCMTAAACCWANLNTVVYSVDILFTSKTWGAESKLRAKDVMAEHPKVPILLDHICEDEGKKLFLMHKESFAKRWNERRWSLVE